MKIIAFASCALLLAATSACGTLGNQPAQLAPVIDSLAHAGCKGNLHFGIGAASASGVSAGSFHVENTFDGSCDPANATAPTVTPLSKVTDQTLAPSAPVTIPPPSK